MTKVFEVGRPKTGTSSLGAAYKMLGLRHAGWNAELFDELASNLGLQNGIEIYDWEKSRVTETFRKLRKTGKLDKLLAIVEQKDAFEDGPWHFRGLYEILFEEYPDSKAIFLTRDEAAMLKSCQSHFSQTSNVNNISGKYLSEDWSKAEIKFKNAYEIQLSEVMSFFAEKPNQLLLMDVCAGEGWEKLCPFLEIPVPKKAFPFKNSSNVTAIKLLKNLLKGVKRRLSF